MRLAFAILALALLSGCDSGREEATDVNGDILTKVVVVQSHRYLAQYVFNGHFHQWQIVAGPIPSP